MVITSTSNPRIKRLLLLGKKRRARDKEKVFLVEGIRMFREVPEELLKELYVSEAFYKKEPMLVDAAAARSRVIPEIVSEKLFEHISDTQSPQGVLCVVAQKEEAGFFKEQEAQCHPFIAVLVDLQDPGNVGTVIRTAEAAGATGIILSDGCADIYNSKTVRATMGSIFRMPILHTADICSSIQYLKGQGIKVYAAHLSGEIPYDRVDYTDASAILIGNEGSGLPEEVAGLADTFIRIPMEGHAESLNAAIAAAVLMFEAGRQRRQDK